MNAVAIAEEKNEVQLGSATIYDIVAGIEMGWAAHNSSGLINTHCGIVIDLDPTNTHDHALFYWKSESAHR